MPVLPRSRPAALAFSEDGSKLYAADGATNELLELRLADLTSQSFALHGMGHRFAVAAGHDSANRQMVYVASSDERLLRVYDASNHQLVASFRLGFQPAGMERFGHGSFLLAPRTRAGDPLWLFAEAPKPGVYFVPEAPSSSGEDRQ